MECIARYDFTPSSARELEIHKNDRLVVQFDRTEGEYVYATRITPPQLQGYVPLNYVAKVDSSGHVRRRKRRTTETPTTEAPPTTAAPVQASPAQIVMPAAQAQPAFDDSPDLDMKELPASVNPVAQPEQEAAVSAQRAAELRGLQLEIREIQQQLREIRNDSDAQIVKLSALSEEITHQQEGWLSRIQEVVGKVADTFPS